MNYESSPNCSLRAFLDLPGCIANISIGHDIVTRKYRIRLVARDSAGGFLWDASANHVPYRRPTEVVEQQTGHACLGGQCVPRFAKVAYRLAIFASEETIFRLLAAVGNDGNHPHGHRRNGGSK